MRINRRYTKYLRKSYSSTKLISPLISSFQTVPYVHFHLPIKKAVFEAKPLPVLLCKERSGYWLHIQGRPPDKWRSLMLQAWWRGYSKESILLQQPTKHGNRHRVQLCPQEPDLSNCLWIPKWFSLSLEWHCNKTATSLRYHSFKCLRSSNTGKVFAWWSRVIGNICFPTLVLKLVVSPWHVSTHRPNS